MIERGKPLKPGDDVWVDFDGLEHEGVVEKIQACGWVRCAIAIDPEYDYGSVTPRLTPHITVAVKTTRIRPRT
ncbi:hypothetical protein SEA_CORNUCOPIA_103 [Mycobacterium phage Cornucopia]|nr:hypothetical protein SEA_CORNUCOPIA_103 [Mycobacterium phage Cornucopia]